MAALARDCEVLVVGAGPAGLMTALHLVERGVQVAIIDRGWRTATHSYALALHPGSLRLLHELGLAESLVAEGRRIEQIAFFDESASRCALDLRALGGQFPFALVVPQSDLEWLLEERLRQRGVEVQWNHELSDLAIEGEQAVATVDRLDKVSSGYPIQRTEWVVAATRKVKASYVVGADGYYSFVRQRLGFTYALHGAAEDYSVYEFPWPGGAFDEVRVVLGGEGASVLWPMAEGRARWSFQIAEASQHDPGLHTLERLGKARAQWAPRPESVTWSTTVQFERRLTSSFGQGIAWLVGDAAHLTGPIGSQSMNVGLREARDLAGAIADILKAKGSREGLRTYHETRTAEWRRLLQLERPPRLAENAAPWVRAHAARIVPAVPASGEDLAKLLSQLGLEF